MSRPKIHSKEYTLSMLPGEARCVYIMECSFCSRDIEVDADTESEAYAAFINEGVRAVDTDDTSEMLCSDCVDLARKNKLED